MSSTITILDLTSEESTSLDTKTVIDRIQQTLYAANGAALFLSIQYKTSEEETCIWSIDVIDQQDIHDAVIFINGFKDLPFEAELQTVKLEGYGNNSSEGGNNWREDAVSPEKEEENS